MDKHHSVRQCGGQTSQCRVVARWLLASAAILAATFAAAPAVAGSSAELAATYAGATARLSDNPFGRAMYIESTESSGTLRGDVFALIEHPFDAVAKALNSPAQWCELLLLHPNVAQCHATGPALAVNLARRFDQKLAETYGADFAFRSAAAAPDYLDVQLDAKRGPVGTRDYLMRIEAMPVAGGKTFLHFAYSYSYGLTARLATQAYLSSKGSDKIGFTPAGTGTGGEPVYVGGLRGAVERNAMRYYLAIDSHLGASALAPPQRFERSLVAWLDAIEQYPRQLREDDRAAYAAVKRGLYRQQAG